MSTTTIAPAIAKSSRKVVWTLAGVLSVVALGAWLVLRSQSAIQYRTVAAQNGDINVTVSATGNPNAVVTVQVGSQVSGTIESLFADFNTKVTKGQLIARINPEAYQAKVDQAQANFEAAQAAVANAQDSIVKAQAAIQAANASLSAATATVEKTQTAVLDAQSKSNRGTALLTAGILSKEAAETTLTTYNSATADVEAARSQQRAAADNVKVAQADRKVADTQLAANTAQVKQFEAALHAAQIDLDHTFIKAPVNGVVVSRNVDVGQTVAASLATPTLFQIAQDLTKMQVDTNVSEADVGRIRVGQPGSFTVEAYPGRTFAGAVTEIREAPINVQNVITYDVVIGVSNADLRLFPGMTANVKILVNQRQNVVKVPNSALRYHPVATPAAVPASSSGARKAAAPLEQAVWVLDANGKPRRAVVTTGESDGTFTEITGGSLKNGDRLIVAALGKAITSSSSSGSSRGPGF